MSIFDDFTYNMNLEVEYIDFEFIFWSFKI